MPYEPVIPEGHHLGTSHEVDGAVTGHLLEDGTNALKGHAAWCLVETPEADSSCCECECEGAHKLTPEQRDLALEIAEQILVGLVVASPHVRRWWSEKVVPAARSGWSRARSPRKANGRSASGRSLAGRAMSVAAATETTVAAVGRKASMSSAEWQRRYEAVQAAEEFIEEQLRILANARIDDEIPALDAQGAPTQLTALRIVVPIESISEGNPAWLHEEGRLLRSGCEPEIEGHAGGGSDRL